MAQGNGTTAAAGTAAQEAFVEQFAAGWAGGAEGFLDHFLPGLVDEQVVLAQPLLPRRAATTASARFRAAVRRDPRPPRGGARLEPGAGRRHDRARAARDARRPAARPRHPRPDRAARRPHPRAPRADGPAPAAGRALRRPRSGIPLLTAPLVRGRPARAPSSIALSPGLRSGASRSGSRAASLRAGWPTRSVPARWRPRARLHDACLRHPRSRARPRVPDKRRRRPPSLAAARVHVRRLRHARRAVGHLRRRDLSLASALPTTALTGALHARRRGEGRARRDRVR